jgi:hypothetical protein
MMLPRRDDQSVQDAINARLSVVQVGGPAQLVRSAKPLLRPANAAALFLLKPEVLMKPGAGFPGGLPSKDKTEAGFGEREGQRATNSDRAVVGKAARLQKREEWVLGAMAALGPVLWLGHALLVWLRVV